MFHTEMVGGAELPLSTATESFQLPVEPWRGTEMVSGAELPLPAATGSFQLPTGL